MADQITFRRRPREDLGTRRRGRDIILKAYEIALDGRTIGLAFQDTRTIERGHPQAPSCISRRTSAPVWFACLGITRGWIGRTTWFNTRQEAAEALVRDFKRGDG
jgi:hypothetical protein